MDVLGEWHGGRPGSGLVGRACGPVDRDVSLGEPFELVEQEDEISRGRRRQVDNVARKYQKIDLMLASGEKNLLHGEGHITITVSGTVVTGWGYIMRWLETSAVVVSQRMRPRWSIPVRGWWASDPGSRVQSGQ